MITAHLGLGNIDGFGTIILWWRDNHANKNNTTKGMARVHIEKRWEDEGKGVSYGGIRGY